NVGGDATMVDLQLLDASGNYKAINVGNTDQVNDMTYVDIKEDGTALLPYAVEYYANGQTTAGTVTSSVVYNLQYK
ncbi:TPA: fimbrial protein, partial [Klebsiella aerogenes]|nr:type 1 fimbrial protein [Klebsiella aerogenes]